VVEYAKINWTANIPDPENSHILSLHFKEGKRPKDIPPDALKHKLKAKTEGALWYITMHGDGGTVPEPLKQRWTKYSMLLNAVRNHFDKRDIEVKEES
jgi:hypothetical protein